MVNLRIATGFCVLLLVAACGESTPTASTVGHNPYPYTTPTPPDEPTPFDGIYTRTVTDEVLGPAGGCIRCPPYRLTIGEEVLGLENGVFRVYHLGIGYMSVGHYLVDAQTITFFNDPNCPKARGTYEVVDGGGTWALNPIDDACAFDQLRARFMSALPWRRLDPPEGIFAAPDGTVLMLLAGRFILDSKGAQTTGTVEEGPSNLTIESEGCAQTFTWATVRHAFDLSAPRIECSAAWVEVLTDTDWRVIG